MEKILVIGNCGSGKTSFSAALAEKSGMPLVHLDRLFWYGTWQHLEQEAFDTALQQELEKPRWIIDGNYSRTLPHRLKYCDTIFFFDLPVVTCLWGITQRVVKNYNKTRTDMGGNCPERFDKNTRELYHHALRFNKDYRKNYYQLLGAADNVHVVVFKSRRQARNYLKIL